MFQLEKRKQLYSIKVVGVGGGGCNIVGAMIEAEMKGVQFIVANTYRQTIERSLAEVKILLGSKLTTGLESMTTPDVGKDAAIENAEKIKAILDGADIVFIIAGMGGGTGTGAAPIIASLARQSGALAIGIITKPFTFEGVRRMRIAEEGIVQMEKNVDAFVLIPSDKVIQMGEKGLSALALLTRVNNLIVPIVRSIADSVMTTHTGIEDIRKYCQTVTE